MSSMSKNGRRTSAEYVCRTLSWWGPTAVLSTGRQSSDPSNIVSPKPELRSVQMIWETRCTLQKGNG
eukprot:6569792-Pyramimonas_sp.AAC.1